MERWIDKYNTVVGSAIALMSTLFGVYWYLFAGYLLLNILDYFTGWWKARKLKRESSKVGVNGILKKLGYWIIILVAFLIPELFIHIGEDFLHINLTFLAFLGWFTLATLLINEIRSILENLVECGCNVPEFLIKGLAVTEKLILAKADTEGKE